MSLRANLNKKINLKEILESIKTLIANASNADDKILLRALESNLIQFDKEVDAIFRNDNREYFEYKLANRPNPKRNASLKTAYDDLKKYLNQMHLLVSKHADCVTDKMSSTNQKLKDIATNLAAMRDLVPTINLSDAETWTDEHLYSFAEALGGTYIRINQSMLPVMGGVKVGDALTPSRGNCGGISLNWNEESVNNGTPKYPITSSVDVITDQDKFWETIKRKYTDIIPIKTRQKVNDTNMVDIIQNLEFNHPHAIYIANDPTTTAHALGVRKHRHCIEIMDPNFGYFFFRDSILAGTWLAMLLQQYQYTKFPADIISIHKHNGREDGTPIPESQFPDSELMNAAVVIPFTENGYDRLKNLFRNHLYYIVQCDTTETKFDLIVSAMTYASLNFTHSDNQLFLVCLESLLDPLKSHIADSMDQFIPFTTYQDVKTLINDNKFNEKIKFAALIDKIKKQNAKNKPIPSSLTLIVEKSKELNRKILPSIKIISNRIRELTLLNKEGSHKREIDNLTAKLSLLQKRRKKFLDSNIAANILAAHRGALAYTEEDARNEFKEIFDVDVNGVLEDEDVNEYIDTVITTKKSPESDKLIAQLTYLLQSLNTLIYVRDLDAEGMESGLVLLSLKKKNAVIKKMVYDGIEQIQQLYTVILCGENPQSQLNELSLKFLPPPIKITHLPEYKTGMNCSDLALKNIGPLLENRITSAFNQDQLKYLNKLYELVSSYGTITRELTSNLASDDLTPSENAIFSDLLKTLEVIRSHILNAIDPAQNLYSDNDSREAFLRDILKEMRALSPSNFNHDGSVINYNKPDFSNYLCLIDLPQRVLDILSRIKGSLKSHFALELERQFKHYKNFSNIGCVILQYRKNILELIGLKEATTEQLNDDTFLENAIRLKNPSHAVDSSRPRANSLTVQTSTPTRDRSNSIPDKNAAITAVPTYSEVKKTHDKKCLAKEMQEKKNQSLDDLARQLKTILSNDAYWYHKKNFTLKLMPAGVSEMKKFGGTDASAILTEFASISTKRLDQSKNFIHLLFGYRCRDDETDALYRLCAKAKKNIDGDKDIMNGCQKYLEMITASQDAFEKSSVTKSIANWAVRKSK